MTDSSQPVIRPTEANNEPLVVKDRAEFLVWSDGDLEIELTGVRFADNGWTGIYLTREEAIRLRDYLVGKYPPDRSDLTFVVARLGTIVNIAEGGLSERSLPEIARLAREAIGLKS